MHNFALKDVYKCMCVIDYFHPSSGYSNASFLATFSTLHPSIVTPLIFDQEVLNAGGNYNPLTGIYIAPLDGDYMFNFHLWCTDLDNLYPFLVVDGQRVFYLSTV